MMKHTLKKGVILVISQFIIVGLILLGGAFMILSTNESRGVERQKMTEQAFYIAEAGIERALYDLRQDYINDTTPSWTDGDINAYTAIASSTYYDINYATTTIGGGSYAVKFKNVGTSSGDDDDDDDDDESSDFSEDKIWIQSMGTLGDVTETIEVYAKIVNVSIWNNALVAGTGLSNLVINGNVKINGSVHILGDGLSSSDYALDLSGSAKIGNNYSSLDPLLAVKIPALETTTHNGETVETLHAEVRVKNGLVGLSGSATIGEADQSGDSDKETIDGVYVTDGWGGNKGSANVYSDNGTVNAYDLGSSASFPSLSDTSSENPSMTNEEYFESTALVLTTELSAIDPTSNFSYSNGISSISMDGNGNLTIADKVYVDEGNNIGMSKSGSNKIITYTGTGTLLVTGNVQIDISLVTSGDDSFPSNILGIMTPNSIGFNASNADVMGFFYAEDTITVSKQTDFIGTMVSNYFNLTNVPDFYEVPSAMSNLPPGMITGEDSWKMIVVSWEQL